MDAEDIDLDHYCQIFMDDMKKGLAGHESSLQMIPTYIEVKHKIPRNKKVIALDAGGTNFRVASIYFDDTGSPVIEKSARYPMPGLQEEVSKKRFFEVIASYFQDIAEVSSQIGFAFSYPTEILPNKDGRLIRFCKEVKAKEVEGEIIGEHLAAAIKRAGSRDTKRVIILNDTVATLLAGQSANQHRDFASYIGFILGTGTNCCYIESNANILKISQSAGSGRQIINVESGAFGKGPRGKIDQLLDESTIDPGLYVFEKMFSGAYLGSLSLQTLYVASKDGMFSNAMNDAFARLSHLQTKDVNEFMQNPSGNHHLLGSLCLRGSENDRIMLYYLLDRLIERAAKLTAINIASVVLKTDKGKNPCYPICITADGTIFYKLKALKSRVEFYLKSYLEEQHEHYYEFVHVKDATLIGAAIAGLTN